MTVATACGGLGSQGEGGFSRGILMGLMPVWGFVGGGWVPVCGRGYWRKNKPIRYFNAVLYLWGPVSVVRCLFLLLLCLVSVQSAVLSL